MSPTDHCTTRKLLVASISAFVPQRGSLPLSHSEVGAHRNESETREVAAHSRKCIKAYQWHIPRLASRSTVPALGFFITTQIERSSTPTALRYRHTYASFSTECQTRVWPETREQLPVHCNALLSTRSEEADNVIAVLYQSNALEYFL